MQRLPAVPVDCRVGALVLLCPALPQVECQVSDWVSARFLGVLVRMSGLLTPTVVGEGLAWEWGGRSSPI